MPAGEYESSRLSKRRAAYRGVRPDARGQFARKRDWVKPPGLYPCKQRRADEQSDHASSDYGPSPASLALARAVFDFDSHYGLIIECLNSSGVLAYGLEDFFNHAIGG